MAPSTAPIRIGILGAAHIVPSALLRPARDVQGIAITALAARDRSRAEGFARKHGIPHVKASYETLLADPAVDAVYIALPAALHEQWTIRAIHAGKHVLVEKPFTSNADAARAVGRAADGSSVIVMEAYHSAYHPFQQRLRDVLASGELGRIVSARASFCIPLASKTAIQWNPELGGGGLLDVGYYPLRLLRDLFGEPDGILETNTWTRGDVDRRFDATLRFPGGIRAELVSSIWSRRLLTSRLDITGQDGSLRATWPCHPQTGARLTLSTRGQRRVEAANRRPSYAYQLEAFQNAIQQDAAPLTGAHQAITQLEAIDALYAHAGMPVRTSR